MLLGLLVLNVLVMVMCHGKSYEDMRDKMGMFAGSIADMMREKEDETGYTRNKEQPQHDMKYEFDFIIVGSGSAGSVLASRLAEIPHFRILLLEAGNPGNALTDIPVFAPLFQLTGFNWNYTMAKQDNFCLAMEDQTCAWPRGKALGGTSVINYMIYTRGNPHDYSSWNARADGWSYDDVLPYYLKSEDCHLSQDICNKPNRRTGGKLAVSYPFGSTMTEAFLSSGEQIGSTRTVDYNSEEYMGFSRIQATIKHGRRHNTAEAFLKPLRDNLKVIVSARVTKILIDPETKRAYGVEFRKRRRNYVVKATKEVVLSAGTFNSPQLLMLSGVGPSQHLADLNIPLIKALPVGKTMYDHIAFLGLVFRLNQTVEARDALFHPDEVINWLFKGRGIYTSLAGIEALAYINTKDPRSTYPDVELIFSGAGSLESDFGIVVARELRIKRRVYDKFFKPLELTPTFTVLPMLLHPKSKGHLKLQSTDPYDQPLLYANFFSDPSDIETLLRSIRYIIKLSETEAFQKFGAQIHDVPIPGCEGFGFNSDGYWKCALKSLSSTLHHQIGTCKMGERSDPEAVVDGRLRVYGVKGLRVADCSVIPVTLSAHTNAPAVMIGEKAADMIKEDWGVI